MSLLVSWHFWICTCGRGLESCSKIEISTWAKTQRCSTSTERLITMKWSSSFTTSLLKSLVLRPLHMTRMLRYNPWLFVVATRSCLKSSSSGTSLSHIREYKRLIQEKRLLWSQSQGQRKTILSNWLHMMVLGSSSSFSCFQTSQHSSKDWGLETSSISKADTSIQHLSEVVYS